MCTGIRLIADNGDIIYARTLEFGQPVNSNIIMIPRNYNFIGTAPNKVKGLSWKSRYAIVGANGMNLVAILDGINEKGLAGGLFYLPDYAHYQEISIDKFSQSIAPWELMTWILTNCATVEEVKSTLPNIYITNTIFETWGFTPPIHAIIHDTQKNSLVIEYIQGKLHMHDNPLGIITNSPTFDWHMTNLKNYLNLAPTNVASQCFDGVQLSPLSQGSGMHGLPGDFTSPSRFIRAALFSSSALELASTLEARHAAFHILNNFDIPFGTVRNIDNNNIQCEITQWTSASDLRNKCYYFHTYQNRQIHVVSLTGMNLDAQEPIIMPMNTQELIIDNYGLNSK